jgi:hypothetical protein
MDQETEQAAIVTPPFTLHDDIETSVLHVISGRGRSTA